MNNMNFLADSRRTQPWWIALNQPAKPLFRLFCFPYAGGSSQVFRQWPMLMDPHIEVLALQLPGRGARLMEPPVEHMALLVQDVIQAGTKSMETGRFAFFGHSMGALIMFEVARTLQARGVRLPECLFASGCQAPQIPRQPRDTKVMSDEEFIAQLHRLEGTPREILENTELIQLILPMIRGDFTLLDHWQFMPSPPLNIPIVGLAGRRDPHALTEDVMAWSEQTAGDFELLTYSGGHFFIQEQERRVVRDVDERIRQFFTG